MLRKIENAAEIEAGRIRAADGIGRLMEQLAAEREIVGNLILQQPAREPIVAIAGTGIDPEAAAAIGRPAAEILLQPKGKISARRAAARPRCALPLGTSRAGKIAICGHQSSGPGSTRRTFAPSSTSPTPTCMEPPRRVSKANGTIR